MIYCYFDFYQSIDIVHLFILYIYIYCINPVKLKSYNETIIFLVQEELFIRKYKGKKRYYSS